MSESASPFFSHKPSLGHLDFGAFGQLAAAMLRGGFAVVVHGNGGSSEELMGGRATPRSPGAPVACWPQPLGSSPRF